MMRTVSSPVVLACALILTLPVAQMALAAGAKTGVSHTVVAASGTAAPAGGNYAIFTHVTVNARSQVAFDASLGGPSTSGVFVADGRRTSTIALGGDPDHAVANFAFVGNSFFTAGGDVVFDANSTDTFEHDGRFTIPLVRNGDPAPGGGTVTPTSRVANARGAIAYQASVIGATAAQGIFRTDGVNTVVIASDAVPAPTGGTFTSLFTPALNNRGQVAFETEMTGGPADFAVLRGDGITLTPVFVANQIAPGGATFQDFGDPLINQHGQVLAVASLVNGASGGGLFVGDGTDAVAIALDGQPAPKGGSYSESFDKPLTINDRGEVAFSARLRGGTSSRGIFRWTGGETTTLGLAGTIAPGTTGTFASFGDMKLGNDGRVAFVGTLIPGVGGVDFSNNMGIWVGTSDADLQLVVRTGQTIDGKVLVRLPTGLGQFDMNDDAIVWIGTFPSRSTAVVFSRTRSESEDTQDRDSSHWPGSLPVPVSPVIKTVLRDAATSSMRWMMSAIAKLRPTMPYVGASGASKGKFSLAHRGSIFLDEIGALSTGLQAKLLRVLQEREIEPLGAERTEQVDVRVIAATNRDLRGLVDQGRFQDDLFHRLHVPRVSGVCDTVLTQNRRQRARTHTDE